METSNLKVNHAQYNLERKSKGFIFWMSEIIQNKYYHQTDSEVLLTEV